MNRKRCNPGRIGPAVLIVVATVAATVLALAAAPAVAGSDDEDVHPGEINVALASAGTTATASSEYGPDYRASNAIDGLWADREHHKWNSAQQEEGPHWLRLDFGRDRTIHRVVVRHEGVYAGGNVYNTSDFQLQIAAGADGPWRELGWPVTASGKNVTVHRFRPVTTRFLRVWITKGEREGNAYGRIFEVEAWSGGPPDARPLLIVEPLGTQEYRDGCIEALFGIEICLLPRHGGDAHCLRFGERELVRIEAGVSHFRREFFLPVMGSPYRAVRLVAERGGNDALLAKVPLSRGASTFTGGAVHIIQASHQDIAWMDTPAACVAFRDRFNITPALEQARVEEGYRYTVEQTMYLMDYLQQYPERFDEIHRRTLAGQFEWGATYNQPYEGAFSGEQLVRETYFGRKWVRKTFPGCDARVCWNTDVPGRTLQTPQILAKAGIPYLMLSRHEEGLFRWESPDGSGVYAYSPGHYYQPGARLGLGHNFSTEELTAKAHELCLNLQGELARAERFYKPGGIAPHLPLWISRDWSKAASFRGLIERWRSLAEKDPALPALQYGTGTTFFDGLVSRKGARFDVIHGERPNVWLYIHGPTHHRAITAMREAARMLPAAEIFSTIEALLGGGFDDYPARELSDAWKDSIFPDHGWGGKNGDVTDRLFKRKLESSRRAAAALLDDAMFAIADRIAREHDNYVTVFNSLSWERTGPVECTVDRPAGTFTLIDSGGKSVAYQATGSRDDGRTTIRFIAESVPSIGYRDYSILPRQEGGRPVTSLRGDTIENDFYRIVLGRGGLEQIHDKELGVDILETDAFAGCEIFTGESLGTGAGEFADVPRPSFKDLDRVRDHEPVFSAIESGPVFSRVILEQPLDHATVRQEFVVYNAVKRIDCNVSLLAFDGTRNREFRLALPVAMTDAKVSYEVPMAVVTVGEDELAKPAGERYTTPCDEIHPREVQDFMTVSCDRFAVTMSSSVAVFDWINPLDPGDPHPVVQPVLLAARKSCHWEGNWYLQPGDHHYSFSIFSHRPGWEGGWRDAMAANRPLEAVAGIKAHQAGRLPPEKSFFSLSAENVLISTLKKCDDDDSVIVRLYDIEGRDGDVRLSLPFSAAGAFHTNLIEEEGVPIATEGDRLVLRIGRNAIETFMIKP